ncbi:PorT family protein [Puteibacter caeruleilacunae]|nr:PorT family protein [Puteibacter caeruleilacunae]
MKRSLRIFSCIKFFLFVFTALIMLLYQTGNAQVAVAISGNLSNIRSDIHIENKEPILGYDVGFSVQYYPIKRFERLSLINEINFRQKGYQQSFQKDYDFRFNYLSFPILIDYSLSPKFSVHTGIELAELVKTNVEGGMDTYEHFDVGLMFGANISGKGRLSYYSRLTYGLQPLLDYYGIDERGNFGNMIHDLKNICLSVGIKFNLRHERIQLYR